MSRLAALQTMFEKKVYIYVYILYVYIYTSSRFTISMSQKATRLSTQRLSSTEPKRGQQRLRLQLRLLAAVANTKLHVLHVAPSSLLATW